MKLDIELAKEMVQTWLHEGTIAGALLRWKKVEGHLTSEEFSEIIRESGFPQNTLVRQNVRAYIANHFINANNDLWNGNIERAWKWMASGKDKQRVDRRMPWTEPKKEIKKSTAKMAAHTGFRERDKSNNWNVCK